VARNIEIKARIDSVEAVLPRARALAGSGPELIEQDDQFFPVPHGRLKLRRFADGSAELIHYHRADGPGARASDYVRVPVPDADALALALAAPTGCWAACASGAGCCWWARRGFTWTGWRIWATSWNWKWCCERASPTSRARSLPTH
jgi:hypothetical protein